MRASGVLLRGVLLQGVFPQRMIGRFFARINPLPGHLGPDILGITQQAGAEPGALIQGLAIRLPRGAQNAVLNQVARQLAGLGLVSLDQVRLGFPEPG